MQRQTLRDTSTPAARLGVTRETSHGGSPTTGSNFERIRGAYSLIGGVLMGTSVALPVLALDAGADHDELVLCVALILAFIGLGLHIRASK
jgi:hypothetical protein